MSGPGRVAVGYGAGENARDAYKWTPADGVVNIGRYPGEVCYTTYDWETGEPIDVAKVQSETRFGGFRPKKDD